MANVSIVKGGASPDAGEIRRMIEEAVNLLGGFESIIEEGDTVAVKPNILTGKLSGPGVTTDPRVIEALVRLFFEAGAGEIMIVEGAGYAATPSSSKPAVPRLHSVIESMTRLTSFEPYMKLSSMSGVSARGKSMK